MLIVGYFWPNLIRFNLQDCVISVEQNQYMSSRCSSAPRMQQVYTPRVRDGRLSNDVVRQTHYYGKTAPRFNPSNSVYQNPENSPERAKPAAINQQQLQNIIDKKIQVDQPKQASRKIAKPEDKRPVKANKQQTIYGRQLEYPAEGKVNIDQCPEIKRSMSSQLMRSSSATSRHFTDRTVKTSRIKQQKAEFDQKFKVAFGYLLENNEAYLKERRRACNQKARPKDENFKINRPTIKTTNHDEYKQKEAVYDQQFEPQNQKTANSFGPRKVCGNSTTNQFHNGRQGPRADLAQWGEGFKLQGPIYGITNYANHYPNHGQFQKMVPIATFNEHPLGMPHRTNSTHRTFFKGEHVDASKLATWNNLHPYGNAFDPNRGTTYSSLHGQKEQQPIQMWPMHDPQLIKSDGKFTTENRSNIVNFNEHELNQANYCNCSRKPHVH